MRRRRLVPAIASGLASSAAIAAIAACGGTASQPRVANTSAAHPTSTSRPRPPTTMVASSTTSAPATTTTRAVTAPPVPVTTAPATTPAAPPPLVARVPGLGSAQQAVTVVASGYGVTTATLTAYERGRSGWTRVFGPWAAYVGRAGVAPPGAKREGDGRTPSGVYGFDFMFGVEPDPGVHFAYRRVTGPDIVWDDDPASPAYNEWVDRSAADPGVNPEPMDNTPSYLYGAVIAYNDARTPGLGSAIFLHVSHASPTAGCVAIPIDELVPLLRWLDPARSPRIAIGTPAILTPS